MEKSKQELIDMYNAWTKNSHVGNNGVVFTDYGEGWAECRMPLDCRTCRPDGKLHGGASLSLAETLAALLGMLNIPDEKRWDLFGISVNANHVGTAEGDYVTGHAEFVHKGRSTQVVRVEIRDAAGKLVSVCTVTNMIKN